MVKTSAKTILPDSKHETNAVWRRFALLWDAAKLVPKKRTDAARCSL